MAFSLRAPGSLDGVDVLVVGLCPAAGDAGKGRRGAAAAGRPVLLPGAEVLAKSFDGGLAAVLADLDATGRPNQVRRVPVPGRRPVPVVLAVGVGADPDADALREAAATALRALRGTARVGVALPTDTPARLAAVVEGAALGGYDFTAFRALGRPRPAAAGEVLIAHESPRSRDAKATLTRGEVLAEEVAATRDLVNTPPGDLSPEAFAEAATVRARAAGVTVEVTDDKALRRKGYGGIVGVGQGSSRPPRLVRLRYAPARAKGHVALVGKGITFDSGGLSLKTATGMETMKSDMAGAATVLGAVCAAARLGLPVAVTGYLALAENMPSGTATRPGDVLVQYGGRTTEVRNTDAEGRLVLADALVRACEEGADAVVDIATLTGAQVTALGSRTAGLMGNDDGLRDRVVAAGSAAGEAFWPMPLPADLREKLDSDVADIANVGRNGNREGGMLVAGLFLREFIADGTPWAHLDVAGPAWNGSGASGTRSPGGTGFGLRTLVGLIGSYAG